MECLKQRRACPDDIRHRKEVIRCPVRLLITEKPFKSDGGARNIEPSCSGSAARKASPCFIFSVKVLKQVRQVFEYNVNFASPESLPSPGTISSPQYLVRRE